MRLAALAAVAGVALAACGGGDIEDPGDGSTQAADCGEFNMAINPWVGYEASAYVVGEVAAQELGCDTEYKKLKEEIAWQGFGTGEVDVVIENWVPMCVKNPSRVPGRSHTVPSSRNTARIPTGTTGTSVPGGALRTIARASAPMRIPVAAAAV